MYYNLGRVDQTLRVATAAAWFSISLENPFVSRVNRRIDNRMVRFWRST
jgi:hypothetical protein